MTLQEFRDLFESWFKKYHVSGYQENHPTHWKVFGGRSALKKAQKEVPYSRIKEDGHEALTNLSWKKK